MCVCVCVCVCALFLFRFFVFVVVVFSLVVLRRLKFSSCYSGDVWEFKHTTLRNHSALCTFTK